MSYTEIFGLTKTDAFEIGEAKNAHRGAMAVWRILEEKYLPSYPLPVWWDSIDGNYYSRTSVFDLKGNAMKEIWDLVKDDKLTQNEKIVLFFMHVTHGHSAFIWNMQSGENF